MKLLQSISQGLELLRITEKRATKTRKDSLTTRRPLVSFATKVKVYPSLPIIEDITQEEFECLWYNKSEIAAIREDCAEIVRLMITGELRETDQKTARGLEHKTPQGRKERHQYMNAALDAVLDEQVVQQYDTDGIADLVRRTSVRDGG